MKVTRCPHCKTSFRVNEAALSVAGGAVRCGSCLQVFRATDHFVEPLKPATPAAEKKAPEPVITTVQKEDKPAAQATETAITETAEKAKADTAPANSKPGGILFTFDDEPRTSVSAALQPICMK